MDNAKQLNDFFSMMVQRQGKQPLVNASDDNRDRFNDYHKERSENFSRFEVLVPEENITLDFDTLEEATEAYDEMLLQAEDMENIGEDVPEMMIEEVFCDTYGEEYDRKTVKSNY